MGSQPREKLTNRQPHHIVVITADFLDDHLPMFLHAVGSRLVHHMDLLHVGIDKYIIQLLEHHLGNGVKTLNIISMGNANARAHLVRPAG